jgi:hypothetical protein
MPMTDADKPSEPDKPVPDERPLWSLTRSEKRILWVTFIGGVASIVVGAVIIGAAIGLDRWLLKDSATGFWLGIAIALFVFAMSAAALLIVRPGHPSNMRIIGWVWVVFMTLYGLAGLGYAAGFH